MIDLPFTYKYIKINPILFICITISSHVYIWYFLWIWFHYVYDLKLIFQYICFYIWKYSFFEKIRTFTYNTSLDFKRAGWLSLFLDSIDLLKMTSSYIGLILAISSYIYCLFPFIYYKCCSPTMVRNENNIHVTIKLRNFEEV